MKWRRDGGRTNAGASETQLRAFEAWHRCTVPAVLRELLHTANGMADSLPVEFRFLPIEEYFSPNDDRSLVVANVARSTFVFLDYMNLCWAYAVDMRSAHTYMVGTADGVPVMIADSVEEFLALFLRDDPRLYPSRPAGAAIR